VQIYDALGKKVLYPVQEGQINIADLAPGIYRLMLEQDNGTHTFTFVKQ
jgi:hypothetical protein